MWSIPTTRPKTVSHSNRVVVFMKPHRSQTIVRTPCHQQLLPARFSDDFHSCQRAHQQELLPPIYLPMEASPKNTFPLTRADLRSDAEIHALARETLFVQAPPPTSASVADKPIHPLHEPRRRQKSPSFSLFLSGHCFCVFLSPKFPLFLCFLKLDDIFRTLGVVSIDSY